MLISASLLLLFEEGERELPKKVTCVATRVLRHSPQSRWVFLTRVGRGGRKEGYCACRQDANGERQSEERNAEEVSDSEKRVPAGRWGGGGGLGGIQGRKGKSMEEALGQ